LLAAIAEDSLPTEEFTSDLFIIPLGENAMDSALTIAQDVRSAGITVEIAFGDRALKGAMKAADKSGARFVVVLGDSELSNGSVDLKRMSDGVVTSVKIAQLQDQMRQALSL
jgi:histidyl-tRNA synthetase